MITHDPNAKLDYWFDWNVADLTGKTWLDGDTITSATVTCDDPAVIISTEELDIDPETIMASSNYGERRGQRVIEGAE